MGATKSDGREKDEGEGDVVEEDSILTRLKDAVWNKPFNKMFADSDFTPDALDTDIEAIIEEIKSDREKERRAAMRKATAQRAELHTPPAYSSPGTAMKERLVEADDTMAVLAAAYEKRAEETKKLQALLDEDARWTDEVDDDTLVNRGELLRGLENLRDETDETIEMAPGVYVHTIDLVIDLVKGLNVDHSE